jgi:parvulin-like peptidyl-prolyl isomerase
LKDGTLKKAFFLFFMGFILLLAFSGCKTRKDGAEIPKAGSRVVAKVNGQVITEEDLNFRLLGPHGRKRAPGKEEKEKEIGDVIQEELLYQQGIKLGLDNDPGYRMKIARLERQLDNFKRVEMARRVYTTQVAAKINITLQDAKDYYEKHADRITTELHLGVISFRSSEEAEEALKKIRRGASFEAIAREVMGSKLPAGREPWDLGFLPWDRIPFHFVDAVYQLKPGEVSGVVASKRTGFEIFRLIGSRKNAKAGFSTMSGIIMNRLRDQRVIEARERYVEGLKKEAKIEIFREEARP